MSAKTIIPGLLYSVEYNGHIGLVRATGPVVAIRKVLNDAINRTKKHPL